MLSESIFCFKNLQLSFIVGHKIAQEGHVFAFGLVFLVATDARLGGSLCVNYYLVISSCCLQLLQFAHATLTVLIALGASLFECRYGGRWRRRWRQRCCARWCRSHVWRCRWNGLSWPPTCIRIIEWWHWLDFQYSILLHSRHLLDLNRRTGDELDGNAEEHKHYQAS